MKLEKDTFRMDLRSAKLCMELDCNTVFDASMYRHCPTCGSVESYPLEAWLNRERVRRPVRAAFSSAAAPKTAPRARWLDRLRSTLPDPARPAVPVALPLRARRSAV
ncbi:MAG TPA: hypothetical protein VID28_06115 [Methylomirabilota bacterium]|jgi:hypothetical protein